MPFLTINRFCVGLLLVFAVAQHAEAGNLVVAWDPPSDPTTAGHVLWWGTQSRNYTGQVDVGLQTTYTVTGLPEGVIYYFAVTAYNAGGESSVYSEEVSVVSGLGAPRNLVGLAQGRLVQLSWNSPPQGGAFDYRLEAGSAPGQSDLGTVLLGPVLGFSAPDIPDGVYYVRVRAIKFGIAGPPSNEVTLIVGHRPCAAAPSAPRSLAAAASGAQVSVNWQPGGGEAPTEFLLEAGSGAGLRDIAALSVAGTSFATSAPNGTYFLRVRSVNACGFSAPSNEVAVTVNDPAAMVPSAPLDLAANVSGATVGLTWRRGSGGGTPTSYLLEVSTGGGAPIGTVDLGNTTSFSNPGTPPGTYNVRVRGANAAGVGPPSATVTVGVGSAVDCVTSAWTLASAGAWSACASGVQTRSETWVRTVITPPANGGAACGPLNETRVGTQSCGTPSSNLIALDPGTVHQTMRGWEAVAEAAHHSSGFSTYAGNLFDRVAAEGIDRVRLEVRAGSENTTDSWTNWKNAGFPASGAAYTAWRAKRYETINDNASASSLNAAGFHFSELNDTIDTLVTPLRQRLAARGESLYVNLNYVAFTGQITSGLYIHHNPAEYAEFMLAAFLHLQARYGWVPDAIEIMLEPDNVTQWSNGTLIGQTIVATAQRLQAHGFTPQFIAPSTTCMGNAVTYFDQLIAVPQAASYVSELAYHRYCGVSAANLQALATRAQTHGLATSMLEWWDAANGYQVLHEDLKAGRNSAWQQGPLSNLNTSGGVGIATVSTSNPLAPAVTTGPLTRYTSHYFQHVRRGARRIGASSTTPTFDPLAFVNTNGRTVVVVKASAGGTFSVQGLPAGTYGIRYTTASASSSHADQTVAAGQSLTTNMPAAGVLTVYRK